MKLNDVYSKNSMSKRFLIFFFFFLHRCDNYKESEIYNENL